jgi:hypothetical protein
MSFSDLFKGKVKVDPNTGVKARMRLSLTGDILSYRRCPRQYGFFSHEGFVPSRASQAFYGNVIHQVLDRCHRYYRGLEDPAVKGCRPPDEKIEDFYEEVATALIAHGVRPHRMALKDNALHILKKFNELEGDTLYPRVKETEYRLEEDRQDFVLRGVVDVLTTGPIDDPASFEIWDYKGSRKPDKSSQLLSDYEWQMCVYAELYRNKTGKLPKRAILYFLNELEMLFTPGVPQVRPRAAVHIVDFDEARIKTALSAFEVTAKDIIACRSTRAWDAPSDVSSITETCNECDLRWKCQAHLNADGSRTYPTKAIGTRVVTPGAD